jgi:acetyl esterase
MIFAPFAKAAMAAVYKPALSHSKQNDQAASMDIEFGCEMYLARYAATDLDPEIQDFVNRVSAGVAAYPALDTLPLPEMRRILETVRAPWTEGGPRMARTTEFGVPTRHGPVRVRIHTPGGNGRKPALVYLHGGGWTFFSLDTHDRLMREYAERAGVAVVGVDYALSPEARFPVALEQVVDVLRWLPGAASGLELDATRIGIGGDSAGANLAIAACIALRDADENLVRAMVLNYGAFEAQYPSVVPSRYGGAGYMLGDEEMRSYWLNYVRTEGDLSLPLVCPLRADLAGLPPALLVIPECDVLALQGHAMLERLWEANVRAIALVYEGATHSFLEAVSIAGVSRRALAETAEWLRSTLDWTQNGRVA